MKKLILLTLLAAMVAPTWAEVTFNGFASIRGGQVLDGDDRAFEDDIKIYNDTFALNKESLFALQATSDLGDGLSATLQMVAEGQSNYDLEARWAYMSYNLTPNSKLLAGRLVNPIFSRSEYQSVGYTYPYARLPRTVYFPFDFNVIDGISWNGNYALGPGDLGVKAAVGSWDGTLPVSGIGELESSFENVIHLSANYSWDGFSVFAGGFRTDLKAPDLSSANILTTFANSDSAALQGAAAALAGNPEEAEVADLIKFEGEALYLFYGFSVDYMDILVDYEYAEYEVDDSGDAKNENYFFSLGYRMGDYTVVAHVEDGKHDLEGNTADASSLTDPTAQAVATNVLAAFATRQFNGSGVTLKYDFHPQAVFKVDYFMYENDPNVGTKSETSGMSVGVDMMF